MTIHASKGLEFDNVIIAGANEGKIPHYAGDLAEEKRVFYVALTRAKQKVFIITSGERSRFIDEIPSRFREELN